MKRLVLDEDVTCVTLNVGSHDDGPCFDEAVLVVGGLNTVDAHELLNYVVDSFYLAFSHEKGAIMGNGVVMGKVLLLQNVIMLLMNKGACQWSAFLFSCCCPKPTWGMSVNRCGACRLRGYFSSSDVEDLVIAL